MPTKVLDFQTPLSVLKASFPTSRLTSDLPLKVFGCSAFVRIHDQNRGKLDPRARKCVFVGYAPTQKGYKCYDPCSRKMFVTMDVTFFEFKPFFDTHLLEKNKDEDSEVFDEFFNSQPTISPENITVADGPNFLINTELSGLNNENLDPKSTGLSHVIDGNKNEGTTDSVSQTIQNSIEASSDTHTEPIHLSLPSSESSRSESSMSDLNKPIAHCKDYTMFTRHSTDGKIAILIVYVDDIILTGDDTAEMERLKQCLASEFEIKDLGSLKFFLGMEIARSKKGIAVSQRKYILDLLKETGISGCRPVETPNDPNKKLGDNKGDLVNTSRYQKLVGKLIYLSHTRPDIAFAVSLVGQFMHSPHEEHLEAVYRILRYLKSSPGKGLFFRKNEQQNLEAYTDADWAGSITDRKSTSGYCSFDPNRTELVVDRAETVFKLADKFPGILECHNQLGLSIYKELNGKSNQQRIRIAKWDLITDADRKMLYFLLDIKGLEDHLSAYI
ncbi:hypothetical protein RJ640_030199 [Escallonia rubra]|uniref:Reverse transcriptase Ty1/copia-type domain-containing protein n=1 Tax=Escallonia rubra TaxID=112253 RepID=A0AA88RRA2_9ASTE|nr:hypothetical protein RJ640_030199 [Escallonia rubra]